MYRSGGSLFLVVYLLDDREVAIGEAGSPYDVVVWGVPGKLSKFRLLYEDILKGFFEPVAVFGQRWPDENTNEDRKNKKWKKMKNYQIKITLQQTKKLMYKTKLSVKASIKHLRLSNKNWIFVKESQIYGSHPWITLTKWCGTYPFRGFLWLTPSVVWE